MTVITFLTSVFLIICLQNVFLQNNIYYLISSVTFGGKVSIWIHSPFQLLCKISSHKHIKAQNTETQPILHNSGVIRDTFQETNVANRSLFFSLATEIKCTTSPPGGRALLTIQHPYHYTHQEHLKQ